MNESTLKMAIVTAHAGADSAQQALDSWNPKWASRIQGEIGSMGMGKGGINGLHAFIEEGHDGMLAAYQRGFEHTSDFRIIAFLHDDLLVHDNDWVDRVLHEFDDPEVGLVGFGGGLGHGSSRLYVDPYDYHQLGRNHFLSNMTDAENHGQRFTGSCDVAVLDGFALIVRRELLEKAGGWPLSTPIGYVCYDYWLCCMARRLGYRIRLVGVSCTHLGGRTFVKLGIGRDPKHWDQYINSHRYIYDNFKDVLPYEVRR
jgi:glycosyltransferase involved in cell wall biosynthesis